MVLQSVTYNVLLSTAVRTGRRDDGLRLLEKMIKHQISADKSSVSLLLKALKSRAEVERGMKTVEKYIDMKGAGADEIPTLETQYSQHKRARLKRGENMCKVSRGRVTVQNF